MDQIDREELDLSAEAQEAAQQAGRIVDQARKLRSLPDNRKFNWAYIPIIARMAAAGFSHETMAALLGVVPKTLFNWADKHHEVRQALTAGKEAAIRVLVSKGLEAAMGYRTRTVRRKIRQAADGPKETVEIEERELPPDPGLLLFFLTNFSRHVGSPDEWQNPKTVDARKVVVNAISPGGDNLQAQKELFEQLKKAFVSNVKQIEQAIDDQDKPSNNTQ